MPEASNRTAERIVRGNNLGHRLIQIRVSAGFARFKALTVTHSIVSPANRPKVATMCEKTTSEYRFINSFILPCYARALQTSSRAGRSSHLSGLARHHNDGTL